MLKKLLLAAIDRRVDVMTDFNHNGVYTVSIGTLKNLADNIKRDFPLDVGIGTDRTAAELMALIEEELSISGEDE